MNEPLAQIVALAARDRIRAGQFAEIHRIPHVEENYGRVINRSDVDAIYNPLHIPAHHPWTLRALDAGKHVLCEKSLACNEAEAIEMRDKAYEKKLVLMDAFHYRYHPLFLRRLDLIQQGEIGEIERIDAAFNIPVTDKSDIRMNYALGGGVTMDIGCYPISWIRHLTGLEPESVTASAEIGPWNVDVFLKADMVLPGGITATSSGDMREGTKFRADVTIKGDKGSLHVTNMIAPQMGHQLKIVAGKRERIETMDRRPTYAYQLDAFLEAVRNKIPIATDGDDAVKQMRVIDRCYESAGLPVRGLNLDP